MSLLSHLAQWAVQGIVIFATGLLPLSITSRKWLYHPFGLNLISFVESLLAWLAAYGMGRLIISGLTSFFGRCVIRVYARPQGSKPLIPWYSLQCRPWRGIHSFRPRNKLTGFLARSGGDCPHSRRSTHAGRRAQAVFSCP